MFEIHYKWETENLSHSISNVLGLVSVLKEIYRYGSYNYEN